MDKIEVTLYSSQDESYTISIYNHTQDMLFTAKVFNPPYPNATKEVKKGWYKNAYDYAYQLSGILGVDFRECK